MWVEPDDILDPASWVGGTPGNHSTHNGYDMREADYIRFWARTDNANQGLQIMSYFGNDWDSYGQSAVRWHIPALTTTWQQYTIYIRGDRDSSNISGGLTILFDKDHDPNPNGCKIYLDDIHYGSF